MIDYTQSLLPIADTGCAAALRSELPLTGAFVSLFLRCTNVGAFVHFLCSQPGGDGMSNFRPLLLRQHTAAAPGRLLTGHEDVVIQPHGRFWLTAGCLYCRSLSLAFPTLSNLFCAVAVRESRRALSCFCLRIGVVQSPNRTFFTFLSTFTASQSGRRMS